MANRGRLNLATRPPHTIEVGCSIWRHHAYVTLDGRRVRDDLEWDPPGRDWTMDLPGLPENRLQVQVRCFFDKVHYPHSHIVVAKWGDARLVIPPAGMDPEPMMRSATPPFSV